MNNAPTPVTAGTVLVGADGTPESDAALRWAARQAVARGARVTALTAWSVEHWPRAIDGALAPTDRHSLAVAAAQLLDGAIRRAEAWGISAPIDPALVEGHPVAALLEAASTTKATGGPPTEAIVVGARHSGPARRLASSVGEGVVRHAHVPVVVVRGSDTDGLGHRRRVVVGVDGSMSSAAAVRWAARAAADRGVPLRVVHAWGGHNPLYSDMLLASEATLERLSREIVESAVKRGLDGAPEVEVEVEVEPVVSPRSPAIALLHEAADAQLLVVGRHGHGGFTDLALGSVSHQCLLYAPCTTAIIRDEETDGVE